MLDKLRSLTVGLSLLVVVAGIAVYLFVQMGGGDRLFGEGDGNLPPVVFEDLAYKPVDVGYLMCPASVCPAAEADAEAELFQVGASELRRTVADFADDLPTIRTFRFDLVTSQFDFTERLPGQGFPAVITVKVLDDTPYSSKLVLYSRQPVGESTSMDHQERLERWVRTIRSRLGE